MKNIYEILADYGLEIPQDKKEAFDNSVKENYKTVSEVSKITSARDNLASQLQTAQDTLKGFEGVDVGELRNSIQKLNSDLAAQKTAYENQIAEMEFDSQLEKALTTAGAKSIKAAKAELDIKALRDSKNRDTDIDEAIKACKEQNGFLFGSDEPINNPIVGKGSQGTGGSDPLAAMRAVMGLPAKEK